MKLITSRRTLDLSQRTIVMGVLNVTPDSFSDGGKYFSVEKAVQHAKQMLAEGADIIDIGGESTRPIGAEKISTKEELKRVIPVIQHLRKQMPEMLLSVDTYKSEVAKSAIEAGADIINDVSGLQDSQMAAVASAYNVPIVINHMRGTPQTHQKGEIVYKDVVEEIKQFFNEKIMLLKNVILDPGFGFGKTVEHNIEILKRLGEFKNFRLPIMIGVSKKNTIGKMLSEAFGREFPPEERLEGSLAATAIAVFNGANIVRVHDVLETRKFFAVFDKIRASE